MDNEEFDEKLKQEIKELNTVPKSVDEKIQKAYKKIEEENKMKKEFKFSKVLSLVATFIIVVFLAGNGIAYAAGGPNIYSWILEKIGIEKEYEEVKTNVNETVESNGIKITLVDIGYDDNFLIAGYKIDENFQTVKEKIFNELNYISLDNNLTDQEKEEVKKEVIEKNLNLSYVIGISDNNTQKYFGNFQTEKINAQYGYTDIDEALCYKLINITSNNEIIIYHLYDISKYEIKDDLNVNIMIPSIWLEVGEAAPPVFEGEWNFTINNLNKGIADLKIYEPKESIVQFEILKEYGWVYNELGERQYYKEPMLIVENEENKGEISVNYIKTSKIGTILKIDTNFKLGVMVDQSVLRPFYAMDLVDSKGNVIIEKTMICNDKNNTFFTKKLNENEEYMIRVFKYYEKQVSDGSNIEYEYVTNLQFNLSD